MVHSSSMPSFAAGLEKKHWRLTSAEIKRAYDRNTIPVASIIDKWLVEAIVAWDNQRVFSNFTLPSLALIQLAPLVMLYRNRQDGEATAVILAGMVTVIMLLVGFLPLFIRRMHRQRLSTYIWCHRRICSMLYGNWSEHSMIEYAGAHQSVLEKKAEIRLVNAAKQILSQQEFAQTRSREHTPMDSSGAVSELLIMQREMKTLYDALEAAGLIRGGTGYGRYFEIAKADLESAKAS